MKTQYFKIVFILSFALLFGNDNIYAQDFQGKATYISKSKMELGRWGARMSEAQKKQIAARLKNRLEKEFVLVFNKQESVFTEEEQLAYDKGFKEALEEFEKSMTLEKGSLKDLTETMFSIGDDFQERLEALIKTKISELNNELLESEIQDFPTPFLNKIKQVAGDIVTEIKDVTLELNHADLELLKGSDVVKNLGFELVEKSDLRRGEFRLISNSTGFQRELSH